MKAELINVKSVAQLLEEADISKFRKWLIRKLIPSNFYDLPVQKIGELQAGSIIANAHIEVVEASGPVTLDIGLVGEEIPQRVLDSMDPETKKQFEQFGICPTCKVTPRAKFMKTCVACDNKLPA